MKLAGRKSALNPRWFILLTVLMRWSRCWSYSLLFVVYSTRRFFYLVLCYFVLVFSVILALRLPINIAITSLGEERASRVVFCTFV